MNNFSLMIIKSLYLQPISMSLFPEINFLSLKIPSKVPYNKNEITDF